LGGSADDFATAVAQAGTGVYVGGWAESANFPYTVTHGGTPSSNVHKAFVARFDAQGHLQAATDIANGYRFVTDLDATVSSPGIYALAGYQPGISYNPSLVLLDPYSLESRVSYTLEESWVFTSTGAQGIPAQLAVEPGGDVYVSGTITAA